LAVCLLLGDVAVSFGSTRSFVGLVEVVACLVALCCASLLAAAQRQGDDQCQKHNSDSDGDHDHTGADCQHDGYRSVHRVLLRSVTSTWVTLPKPVVVDR
jgi:hypothetical protein